MPGLSARGVGMVAGGLAPYIDAHFARAGQPGYVGLCVAENHQVADLLRPRLEHIPPVPDHVLGYDDAAGKQALREAVAALLGREVLRRPVDPGHVQVLAGASGVLDALGHALGDPGDAVIIPTPSYAGFWPDLEIRPGLEVVTAPTSADDGFRLTEAVLDDALGRAEGRARVLLLTNPDNPRGEIRPAEEVAAALSWADAHDLHVVADEVYALSAFAAPFESALALRPDLGERVHLVWAFSKDLGMSGLRTGVLVTQHEDLRRAVELQGTWQGVSGHTQHVLSALAGDEAFMASYLAAMRAGLASTAARVVAALDEVGIAHTTPQAGFFLLCDLRPWLAEPTWEAEHALWARLLEEAGVNLTPGSALRAPEPGWARLCYASNPPDVVVDAIQRVGALLG